MNMRLGIATDHDGFELKAFAAGHKLGDCGEFSLVPGDDYPDLA